MHYLVVNVLDPAVDDQLRLETRPAHLAYSEEHRGEMLSAGRMMSDDGTRILGGFFLLDVPDRAAAEAFVDAEPYKAKGIWSPKIFEAVAVADWSLSTNGGRVENR